MEFIRKILDSPIFKISSLNTASVLVRVAGGLLSSKIIALFLGPAGLTLVGGLRNFLTSIDAVTMLGFQNGIIKNVAEHEKDSEKLGRILSTIFLSIFAVMLLTSLVLILAASYWSKQVFSSVDYGWVFIVLALSLPWYTGNLVIMSVLNGLGKYKNVIFINIWGNITGVLLSAVLIWQLRVPGALLGVILSPALMFMFSFYHLKRQFPGLGFLKVSKFDNGILRGLFSYSFMSMVTAILGPVVFISIRNTLIQDFSADEAGFWDSINRISVFYFLFVSTMLTVYFLPRLSMAKTRHETHDVFMSYYKTIIPVFAAGLVVVYFLRGFIVRLLFSEEFLPVTDLFLWQLLGDFFKAASLILGYEFFAKKMTRAFIVTEIMSYAVLYFSSRYLIELYGSEGAVMAHAFTYCIYLAVLALYFRKKLFGTLP